MTFFPQIRAKNQLRVNGLGFFLYFGTMFTVMAVLIFVLCGALIGLAWVRVKSTIGFEIRQGPQEINVLRIE